MYEAIFVVFLITGIPSVHGKLNANYSYLVISGVVSENGQFVRFQDRCVDHESSTCRHFIGSLCNTTDLVLREHPDLKLSSQACHVKDDSMDPDCALLALTYKVNPPKKIDLGLVNLVIPPYYAAYKDVHFAGVAESRTVHMVDIGLSLLNSSRQWLGITGIAVQGKKIMKYEEECRDNFAVRCLQFENYLCNKTGEALRKHPKFKDLYSTCMVRMFRDEYLDLYVFPYKTIKYETVDLNLLEVMLPPSTITENEPYLGFITNTQTHYLDYRRLLMTDPTRHRLQLIVNVKDGDAVITFPDRCMGLGRTADCLIFRNSPCKQISKAFNAIDSRLYSACKVERKELKDKFTNITVYLLPGHPDEISVHQMQDRLKENEWTNGWPYISYMRGVEAHGINLIR